MCSKYCVQNVLWPDIVRVYISWSKMAIRASARSMNKILANTNKKKNTNLAWFSWMVTHKFWHVFNLFHRQSILYNVLLVNRLNIGWQTGSSTLPTRQTTLTATFFKLCSVQRPFTAIVICFTGRVAGFVLGFWKGGSQFWFWQNPVLFHQRLQEWVIHWSDYKKDNKSYGKALAETQVN